MHDLDFDCYFFFLKKLLSSQVRKPSYETTVQITYTPPRSNTSYVLSPEDTGQRKKMLEKDLYEMVSSEVAEEQAEPPPSIDFTSTTRADFYKSLEGRRWNKHVQILLLLNF